MYMHCDKCSQAGRSGSTVDLEIFVLENFRVLNFRVKIFSWSRIPTKLNRFYVPRFGDLERDTARQENVEFAAFVAVGELLARGRTL